MTYTDHTGLQTDEMEYQEGARPIWGGGPSGLGLGDAVARFGKHLVNWLATFGPGRVGKAAGVVEIATESGDGDASLIPLIGGATGVLAKFLKSQSNQKKLQNVLKKHLSGRHNFDCDKVANALIRDLDKLGVPNNKVIIEGGTDFMFYNGEKFSVNRFHYGVRIGDRVYDKVITGPSGASIADFKRAMNDAAISPKFTGLD